MDEDLPLSLSVGVAGWLPVQESFELAFARADIALYEAKRRGPGNVFVLGVDG